MIVTADVLAAISRNPWTALVISADGQVAEVVSLSAPSSDAFVQFTQKHARGRRFRLIQQADLTEAELNAMLSEIRRPLTADAPGSSAAVERVEAFQSGMHPLAALRVIAEAITKWLSR